MLYLNIQKLLDYEKSRELNLYRMLYLNGNINIGGNTPCLIEPIQNVVFKSLDMAKELSMVEN